ncbi:MAG: hypothetical protein JKY01_04345 [Pseudomonadales bacterium]|nr:hypothetical protein [Pseudomonadales bacterium]
MNILKLLVPIAVATLLIGCGKNNDNKVEKEERPVIFEKQLDALEKAKGVETVIMEAEEKRRKEIDENGS